MWLDLSSVSAARSHRHVCVLCDELFASPLSSLRRLTFERSTHILMTLPFESSSLGRRILRLLHDRHGGQRLAWSGVGFVLFEVSSSLVPSESQNRVGVAMFGMIALVLCLFALRSQTLAAPMVSNVTVQVAPSGSAKAV